MEFLLNPRTRITFALISLLCFSTLGQIAALYALEKKSTSVPFLAENGLRHGSIAIADGESSVSFRMKIEPGFYGVGLRLQSAGADLDMTVEDQSGNVVWQARTPAWNEKLFLYRMGNPGLEDGEYRVNVRLGDGYTALMPSATSSSGSSGGPPVPTPHVDFDLDYQVIRLKDFAPISLSSLVQDTLSPEQGMVKAYRVLVPAGTARMRADIFGSQTDTDLFAQVDQPFSDPRKAQYAAQTWRSRESLLIDIPGAAGATVYLVVLSEMDDTSANFSLLASPGDSVPSKLKTLPDFSKSVEPGSLGFLQPSLDATVELLADTGGGSGCVISPNGWIVTNLHVLRRSDGSIAHRLSVGFTRDYREIPDSQFWAELVESDAQRDLALLHIVSGFYGQPLPQGYSFPCMHLARVAGLNIGDTLYFSGYPTIGGLGNRATLTCTQGIVSGFQQRAGIEYVKTAATISSGNSGGAAIDGQGSCVGFPTIVVGSEASQIAYIVPVDTIPAAWLARAGITF